ncbi:MAG: pyrimidine-nucleoside phosphorylase [Pygmaiobacter massiliensis]|nr:pyrimidine-nucleoside phosphorylase [Pygmaiobacter massiliensis]
MRMYDIIAKKRDGGKLSQQEIQFAVNGYVAGQVPDYQMSALLMAIYLRGMDAQETAILTDCMARSGDQVDLSAIPGVKVDKHSTGGVGDKTTLVVAPLVAACGAKIAKMSGRGLGHTGGTIDKMESIPGMRTSLDQRAFFEQVEKIGLAVIGQTGNLAPADKKMYALRDVTATVGCIPLIASSIMSKKLAAGADAILLDVKTGNGAFMKTLEDSIQLAKAMVEIGEHNGRRTAALVTDMDTPLGFAVGNSLEVAEVVRTLKGEGPQDLTSVCLDLAAGLLELSGLAADFPAAMAMAKKALESGVGLAKLRQMVAAQGGDVAVIDNPDRFEQAKICQPVYVPKDGYICRTDTEQIGIAAVQLGAGREKKEDAVDFSAGIVLCKKAGDWVHKGDTLAWLYTSSEEKALAARQTFLSALTFGDTPPAAMPLVLAKVTKDGIERFDQ